MALLIAACSGGGDSAEPTPSLVTTTTTSTTTPPADPDELAAAASLTIDDMPDGWEERDPQDPVPLDSICPDVAAELEAAETLGDRAARARFVARDEADAIPAVRQEIYLYSAPGDAASAYHVRASGEHALCSAAVGTELLEGESRLVGSGFREVEPGDLGTESRSWVVSFALEEGDARVDASFEIVTFRVGPLVSTVLITTGPAFPLAAPERAEILATAAARAEAAG